MSGNEGAMNGKTYLVMLRTVKIPGMRLQRGQLFSAPSYIANKLTETGVIRRATQAELSAHFQRLRDEARENSRRGYCNID